MKNSRYIDISHLIKHDKIFWRNFLFCKNLDIGKWSKLKLFLKKRHEKLYISCMKRFLLKNKTKFQTLFIMLNAMAHGTIIDVFHFEYGKDHWHKATKIYYYHPCTAFQRASFLKNSRLYPLLTPRYIQNKKCRKTSGRTGICASIIHANCYIY